MQRSLRQCLNLGLTTFSVLCAFSTFTLILNTVINLKLMCFEFYKSGLCSLEGCFWETFAVLPSYSDKPVATAASTLISLLGTRLVAPLHPCHFFITEEVTSILKAACTRCLLNDHNWKGCGLVTVTVRPGANALNWSLPEWTSEISDLISQRCSCITTLFTRMNSSRKAYRTLWLVLYNKYINQRKGD